MGLIAQDDETGNIEMLGEENTNISPDGPFTQEFTFHFVVDAGEENEQIARCGWSVEPGRHLDRDALQAEMVKCKELVEEQLGKPVEYQTRGDFIRQQLTERLGVPSGLMISTPDSDKPFTMVPAAEGESEI